ncbi:MAG: xanthine phosphoribosyltransferase [Oscillibacter sp.]|nr:xanthine phosphoribosyltransferase [Oscillibacter sp.]
MRELQERILKDGAVLPDGIIKVGAFLNHRVDPVLMEHIAAEFGKRFDMDKVTLILTAESSGIAVAAFAARKFGKPFLFAKKAKSKNISGDVYRSEVFSHTYRKPVTLMVSREWIRPSDRVLILDDFLANGAAARGLLDLVRQSGAEPLGIGCVIEKGFQGGGDRLRAEGVRVESLAILESAEPGHIVFRSV